MGGQQMKSLFHHFAEEEPLDSLSRAQSILSFVQSWAEMWQERTPLQSELDGLCFTLETAKMCIEKAQNRLEVSFE